MSRIQYSILPLLLAAWGSHLADAQDSDVPDPVERGWCGSVVPEEFIAEELDRLNSGFYDQFGDIDSRAPGDYKLIRVAVHIVRRTNGTGGISASTVQSALNTANVQFAPSKFYFVVIDLDYIDSDTYFTITEPEDDALRQVNVVANAVNLYFVDDAPYCGESTFPAAMPGAGTGPQGIVLQNSCIGAGGVLAHEIGHYFSLLHTHETAAGADCPGGTQCASRGDFCCDTPPDPGLHLCSSPSSPGSCVNSSCAYTGTFTCNGLSYNPSTTNTMSYTDYDNCMNGFTANQNTRIISSLSYSDRVSDVMMEHPCDIVYYASSTALPGVGTWTNPTRSIRTAAIFARTCNQAVGGVVVAQRGLYFEGTAVIDTPVTITASEYGVGSYVELRP